jgi:hypothetical protein
MDYGSEVLSSSTTGIAPKSQQPKFTGSTRQVRGQIIKILTESDAITREKLITEIEPELLKGINIDDVLNQLEDDRLVCFTSSGKIRIAE